MIGYPAIDDITGLSAVKEEQDGSYQDYYRPGYPVYRGQRSKSRMGREEDPRSPAGYAEVDGILRTAAICHPPRE